MKKMRTKLYYPSDSFIINFAKREKDVKIKGFFRRTKKGMVRVGTHNRGITVNTEEVKKRTTQAAFVAGAAALTFAGITGIGIARVAGRTGKNFAKMGGGGVIDATAFLKYPANRSAYRQQMVKTVDIARKRAETVDVEALFKANDLDPEKGVITIGALGFGGTKIAADEAAGLKAKLYRAKMKDYNILPLQNTKFNVESDLNVKEFMQLAKDEFSEAVAATPMTKGQKRILALQLKEKQALTLNSVEDFTTHMKKVGSLIEGTYFTPGGRNKYTEDVLTQVFAIQKKYPEMKFNLIGSSGGGFAVQESSEILDRLKIPHKAVTVGTPDIGFFKLKKENVLGLIGLEDKTFRNTSIFNRRDINAGINHDFEDYFGSENTHRNLKEFLYTPKVVKKVKTKV